jgi:hypothetical protein
MKWMKWCFGRYYVFDHYGVFAQHWGRSRQQYIQYRLDGQRKLEHCLMIVSGASSLNWKNPVIGIEENWSEAMIDDVDWSVSWEKWVCFVQ